MTGERPRRPRLAVLSRRGPLILSRNHQVASDETMSRPNRLSVSQEDLVIEVRPASAGILRSFDGGSGAVIHDKVREETCHNAVWPMNQPTQPFPNPSDQRDRFCPQPSCGKERSVAFAASFSLTPSIVTVCESPAKQVRCCSPPWPRHPLNASSANW